MYQNSPLGENTLGQFMKNISKMASLSEQYTNHSVRSTHIDAGFEARHIMKIIGHKSESSI